jgi:imidazolonepropionase-like amidohydrolase
MRLRVWYLAIVLLLPVHVLAAESPAGVLVFAGGRVIDGFGGTPIENAVVVVRGNRIEAVGRAGAVAIPGEARTIDVSGMTVLPGLWESHGHLMHIGEGDPDQFPANYAARAREVMGAVARTTLLSGITTFRDTGGPLEAQQALRADIEAGRTLGPRLYLAGPILRQRQPDPRMPAISSTIRISRTSSHRRRRRAALPSR